VSTELLTSGRQRGERAAPVVECVSELSEQKWLAGNGLELTLREVRESDRAALERFYADLSELSRYQRFFSGQPGISEPLLEKFTHPERGNHIGLVVWAGSRIIADARLVATADGEAEIAAVVADAWQGRGVGRRLFRTLISAGRARGWHTLRADFFSDNRRIIGLLRDAGFTLGRDGTSAVFGRALLEI